MDSIRSVIRDLREVLECEILAGRRKASFDDPFVAQFAGVSEKRASSSAAPAAPPPPAPMPAAPMPATPQAPVEKAASAAPMQPLAAPQPSVPAPPAFTALEAVADAVRHCAKCPLSQTRTHCVPGEGNGNAPDVMFVGEAPGHDEDLAGRPFVGRAGQLLDKMIAAMGFRREEVFIANILKCRPPNNRTPTVEEMAVCIPFLRNQISLVRPKVIVALGATAYRGLKNDEKASISRARGIWDDFDGIPLMPTFHPAYLLRTPGAKRIVWNDLKMVLARLGRAPAAR